MRRRWPQSGAHHGGQAGVRKEAITQTIDFEGDSVHRSWIAEEYDQHNVPEDEEETACAIDEGNAENLFTEFSDPERIDKIPNEKFFQTEAFQK